MEFVPVVYSDMDDEMAKKYRILDNKLAEKSSFDEDQLLDELRNMDVPTDMQAFFFEDINQMLNFSLDSIKQQAEEYGGFQDDYSQVEEENFEAPSNEEAGESEESPSDVEEDPAKETASTPRKASYVVCTHPDGGWQVKKTGSTKAIRRFDTKAEADAYAKKVASNNGATVIRKKKDGKIQKKL